MRGILSMKVNCPHWKEGESQYVHGYCGPEGKQPNTSVSFGTCHNCELGELIGEINIKKGVIGMAKVATGRDKADRDVIAKRLKTCRGCDYLKRGQCELCGCLYKLKVRLKSEQCPINKW